jgi:hypothetical protein|tara:strand:- start:622 stop:843 length:222 start_codon:yes stop_codon:yes gene_type:complete
MQCPMVKGGGRFTNLLPNFPEINCPKINFPEKSCIRIQKAGSPVPEINFPKKSCVRIQEAGPSLFLLGNTRLF